jgi:hypothetical protein
MGRFHRVHDQPRSQYIWPRENAVEEVEPDLEEGLEGLEMRDERPRAVSPLFSIIKTNSRGIRSHFILTLQSRL